MKKTTLLFVLVFGLVGMLATVPAFANTLYNNNTANSGNLAAWNISANNYIVSDSFTLSASSTVTNASFYAWLTPGDSLESVEWSIGTTPYSNSLGSGTAFTSQIFRLSNSFGASVDQETFTIPNLSLSAGTYWFTLQDALVYFNSDSVYWDVSNGTHSTAYVSGIGNINGYMGPGTNSESFYIIGTPDATVTPEPSSFWLLGSGLAGLAGLIKRKLMA